VRLSSLCGECALLFIPDFTIVDRLVCFRISDILLNSSLFSLSKWVRMV